MSRRSNILQRTGAILFALSLISCAQLRANEERHLYSEVIWALKDFPEEYLKKCGYDLDAPYPGFVADEKILADWEEDMKGRKRPHLKHRIVIHYNPHQSRYIRHESVHYLNRMKLSDASFLAPDGITLREKVSWDCLDQVSAHAISEYIYMRDQVRIYRKRERIWRTRAQR